MKHRRQSEPEWVVKRLINGLSMNDFYIGGTMSITIMSTLRAKFNLAYTLLVSPLAIMMRKYEDMRVQDQMV